MYVNDFWGTCAGTSSGFKNRKHRGLQVVWAHVRKGRKKVVDRFCLRTCKVKLGWRRLERTKQQKSKIRVVVFLERVEKQLHESDGSSPSSS